MILDRPEGQNLMVKAFVLIPFLALLAAVPLAWGWGLSWVDAGLAVFFYFLTLGGATVGFHRHFTHRSFKARRPLRIALAVVGSMALQGPVITWVADHRRHHAFTDREGDPHSPWLFGTTPAAVAKGFWHSHFGWMLHHDLTNPARFAPDLLADRDVTRVNRQFPLWTAISLLAPAVAGGLITWSWWGALTAFFWAGLVRVGVLHHVTWSVNSICHMIGDRPWTLRDRSTNFWPLAVATMGESWHNLHHADPTCARHGVGRCQIDMSARIIAWFEYLGWAHDVRWPTPPAPRPARRRPGPAVLTCRDNDHHQPEDRRSDLIVAAVFAQVGLPTPGRCGVSPAGVPGPPRSTTSAANRSSNLARVCTSASSQPVRIPASQLVRKDQPYRNQRAGAAARPRVDPPPAASRSS